MFEKSIIAIFAALVSAGQLLETNTSPDLAVPELAAATMAGNDGVALVYLTKECISITVNFDLSISISTPAR